MVAPDSPIKTLADLKGKRLGVDRQKYRVVTLKDAQGSLPAGRYLATDAGQVTWRTVEITKFDAPKAQLFNKMTTKIALGAVVTRVPAMTDFDRDPLEVIETGDWVKVDADKGVVEVTKRARGKP